MKKNKILIIAPTPPPYHGVSVATEMLLKSDLSEMYNLLHIDIADRRGIEFVDEPDIQDVFLFFKQFVRAFTILWLELPQITYLAVSQRIVGFIRDSFFILLANLFNCKVVIHLHGGNFQSLYLESNILLRHYIKYVMRRVSHAIVLGNSLIGNFKNLIPTENIKVIPNGIYFINDIQTDSRQLKSDRRNFRILYLGTLNILKGISVLVRSIPILREHHNKFELVLAGDWWNKEDEREIKEFIDEYNLSEFVKFTGQVVGFKKYLLYKSADVFVFPGIQQEGQPLVVLEAMAAGLPIIYTNRGCLRETVINGVNGLEIVANDPNDLAEKILWIINHAKERNKMGLKSKERYEALYTSHKQIKNMKDFFSHIMAAGWC
jgi:glycosyltransferase involved in cell wall biosynthesis